jgi:receptor protein-tyrosine kinase
VIEELRAQFDYVIIDTPPLIKFSDGTVPAALGDGALLLGRLGHTKAAGLRKALAILATANVELIGVVATGEHAGRKDRAEHRTDEQPAETARDKGETSEVIGQLPAVPVNQEPGRPRHRAQLGYPE